jgi:cyanophycin synthetase
VLSAEDAWAAACEIGCPVVVKPQDGNQGKGVAVNLGTREQIEAAYAIAFEVSDEVLVERFLPGHDYRLLVVGDKLIAAARRDPPLVIGDGVHSIGQLVERVNSDPAPRRRPRHLTDPYPTR